MMRLRRKIAILGATGSIGGQALDIARRYPERFEVVCLTARASAEKLLTLVREFRPRVAALETEIKGLPEDVRFCEWVFGKDSSARALAQAPRTMVDFVEMMLDALKNLVFHGEGVDEMAGPVGIISVVSEVAREGFYMVLYILFVISLNLGLMNLLPLPALDGGRLVFLIVEAIRRKPIPPEKEGMVHGVGMLLLLGLILVITYQDIVRLIAG